MISGLFGWSRGAVAAGFALAAQTLAPAALADPIADFYKGKTVTILIGHPPGGSYDLYAQLAAAHLGRHIPGKPNVVVQGMPGGGGSLAAAFLGNKAPRDGTTVALLPESLAHTQLLEPEKSRWDISKMKYVGSFADVTSVMMVRKGAPAQTLEDFKKTRSNVSCSGKTTTSAQSGAILKHFTGLNFNMVCGYDSATASILAVFKGEADVTTTVWTTWTVNYQQQMDAGEIKPVVQFGTKRLADLPNVPTAIELITDPKGKQAMAFFASGGEIGRALLLPPGVPADKTAALVKAFDALVADPEFLADAKKRSIPISPRNAAAVQESVDTIFKTEPAIMAVLNEAMDKGFE